MGAAGFGTLAGYFTDRTVVTYDPRGVERSTRTDDARESTPTSTPTICTGSSPPWIAARWTCSPAAAAL